MLIPFRELFHHITTLIKGVIHIGAHECEELGGYSNYFGLHNDKIIWIDAIKTKVDMMKNKIPSLMIYNECISDVDDKEVEFKITNNYESSSILDLKTHLFEHPHIYVIHKEILNTKKMKTFMDENKFDSKKFNFLNLDIQGAELLALKGFEEYLEDIDYIYTEVNINELYDGCALLHQIDEYLSKYNFKRVMIELTQHGWGDAFYIKN